MEQIKIALHCTNLNLIRQIHKKTEYESVREFCESNGIAYGSVKAGKFSRVAIEKFKDSGIDLLDLAKSADARAVNYMWRDGELVKIQNRGGICS